MSDNWIIQNLENALEVWNDKLSEIWQLITQSPQDFKGGSIWNVISNIHGALQAIAAACGTACAGQQHVGGGALRNLWSG